MMLLHLLALLLSQLSNRDSTQVVNSNSLDSWFSDSLITVEITEAWEKDSDTYAYVTKAVHKKTARKIKETGTEPAKSPCHRR